MDKLGSILRCCCGARMINKTTIASFFFGGYKLYKTLGWTLETTWCLPQQKLLARKVWQRRRTLFAVSVRGFIQRWWWAGQENLPILLAALTKCTFWSEDISNALLEVIIFFLWSIDYHYVQNEFPLKHKMHFPYKSSSQCMV